MAAALAALRAGTAFASCEVFPPDYAIDASETEIAQAVVEREQWVARGCAENYVERQKYFQSLTSLDLELLEQPT